MEDVAYAVADNSAASDMNVIPSWAIGLIVIGCVVLVALIVVAIQLAMLLRAQ